MRTVATVTILIAGLAAGAAHADPYKWCAVYSGGDTGGGGTSCYFWTIEQCRASVSGVGGFCVVNQFYDGRPVRTPEDPPEAAPQSGAAGRKPAH